MDKRIEYICEVGDCTNTTEKRTRVQTANGMLHACKEHFDKCVAKGLVRVVE